MAETLQGTPVSSTQRGHSLVRAVQVARDADIRESANGVHFATFGETGVSAPDLTQMLEAVPPGVAAALRNSTYFFVPLALREAGDEVALESSEAVPAVTAAPEPVMVSSSYTDDLSDAAICHRNIELAHGRRGVFISTRLMGDRFALSFEFFINVAHALSDSLGVPERFAELAWKQAVENVRGETSLDAWESRNLAFGRPAEFQPEPVNAPTLRKGRRFGAAELRPFSAAAAAEGAAPETPALDEKERKSFLEAAFSDAVAIYLLTLALDVDYSELREREYPLLAPAALAERLRLVAELFPPGKGYEFSLRYKRRA